MPYAYVQNHAGKFVEPTLDSSREAASQISGSLPEGDQNWVSVNILNAPGQNSYPIVTFSYLLVYKELSVVPQMDERKATELVNFLWYVVHDGQNYATGLSYVTLPANVVSIDERTLRMIAFNAKTLHP
jgi:ABC-type phosphate transport system substrate-binding protein